jgi:23S rRNA (adenine2503-C2)-methyltransferase
VVTTNCQPSPETSHVTPAIRKLADEEMQVRLAVSLHTPDDELRDTLVPVNNRWSVDEVLQAARYYADMSGRRVSIEYALIRDINDQPWRATMLAKVLRKHLGHLVHVNVIPLNPTPGSAAPPSAHRCAGPPGPAGHLRGRAVMSGRNTRALWCEL